MRQHLVPPLAFLLLLFEANPEMQIVLVVLLVLVAQKDFVLVHLEHGAALRDHHLVFLRHHGVKLLSELLSDLGRQSVVLFAIF